MILYTKPTLLSSLLSCSAFLPLPFCLCLHVINMIIWLRNICTSIHILIDSCIFMNIIYLYITFFILFFRFFFYYHLYFFSIILFSLIFSHSPRLLAASLSLPMLIRLSIYLCISPCLLFFFFHFSFFLSYGFFSLNLLLSISFSLSLSFLKCIKYCISISFMFCSFFRKSLFSSKIILN